MGQASVHEGLALRAMEPSDRAFVASTWVRSYKDASLPKAFLTGHSRVVDSLLSRVGATVLCDAGDTNTLHGWACTEGQVLHYVYVPMELRKQGFAKLLIPDAPLVLVSHKWPFDSRRFVFNPYLVGM